MRKLAQFTEVQLSQTLTKGDIHPNTATERSDGRRKFPKKVLRHQTIKRIDRLTADGRTAADPDTDYSSSQLNGYELLFDLVEDRTGYCPGMTAQEIADADRARDIRECYAADTHAHRSFEDLECACKDSGLHIFDLALGHWSKLKQFDMIFKYHPRVPSSTPKCVPVRPPLVSQYEPIPIEMREASKPKVRVMPTALRHTQSRPAAPDGPPIATHKCKRYVPGNDGECMCERCYKHALKVAEWWDRQKRESPAA